VLAAGAMRSKRCDSHIEEILRCKESFARLSEDRLGSIAPEVFPALLPKRDSCESGVWYLLCSSNRTDRAISWFVPVGSRGTTE
jgi:hypothetical protein